MSRLLVLPCVGILIWPIGAQTQSVGFAGPIVGLIYNDNVRNVQPIVGFPGSAYLGSPVLIDVDQAAISPAGDWAWVRRGGRSVFMGGLLSAVVTEAPSDGLINGIDRVAWARDGSAALLYSPSSNQLQAVHFSGVGIVPDIPIDVPSARQVTTLAISSAGQQIVASITGPDGDRIYAWIGGEGPILLTAMQQLGTLTVSDDGKRIYAVDKAAGNILEIPVALGAARAFVPLDNPDAIGLDPVGLVVSPDNRYLLVTDRAIRAVFVYDTTSTMLVTRIPLDFRASRLERVSVDSVFALNVPGEDEWLILLDARKPRIEFVPAKRSLE
jgi:hypothetical protein